MSIPVTNTSVTRPGRWVSPGLPVGEIAVLTAVEPSGYVNPTALSREVTRSHVIAVTDVTILEVPVALAQQLALDNPRLARDITDEIDRRRALIRPVEPRTALASAAS